MKTRKMKTRKMKTRKMKTRKTIKKRIQSTTRKITNLLPKLKPSLNNKKKYHYKLSYKPTRRRLAINEGIRYEVKKGRNRKQAATAKKGRLNILRIYRRNKKLGECNKITSDMKYIDRKYGLGETKNICKK